MDIPVTPKKETLDQTVVEQVNNKPKRKYDIIVYGASGFTGQLIVMEMVYFSQAYNLTWAIAGRNKNKLQEVLDNMYKKFDGFDGKKIDIICADVYNFDTVSRMAQTTSVIINCVGPYYIYGEVVVKSCVINSTHYVDITGESLFMEKMAFMYNSRAESSGSVIVSALGMESVPADLGIEFLYKNFNGELQNVNMYMKLYSDLLVLTSSAFIHDGTWISAILHLATSKERLKFRTLLDKKMGINRVKPEISKILHKQQISICNDKKEWCLAFTDPDQAIVTRSIHHAKTVDNLPYNFNVRNYMVIGSIISATIVLFFFVILSLLATLQPFRILFVRYPRIFSFGVASRTGPNEKLMNNSQMALTLIGHGSTLTKPTFENPKNLNNGINSKRTTTVKVKAKNPGYGFTSKAVILGAITILKDQNIPRGGVLTPAAAFRNTQYMDRLIEHNAATFEVESDLVTY